MEFPPNTIDFVSLVHSLSGTQAPKLILRLPLLTDEAPRLDPDSVRCDRLPSYRAFLRHFFGWLRIMALYDGFKVVDFTFKTGEPKLSFVLVYCKSIMVIHFRRQSDL